jgi:hypothetical protein
VPALNEVQFYHNNLVEVLSVNLFLLTRSPLLAPLHHTHCKDTQENSANMYKKSNLHSEEQFVNWI